MLEIFIQYIKIKMIKNRKTYNLFKKVVLSKQKECKKKTFSKAFKMLSRQ